MSSPPDSIQEERLRLNGRPVHFPTRLAGEGTTTAGGSDGAMADQAETLLLAGNWHTAREPLAEAEADEKLPVLLLHSFGGNKQEYNGLFLRLAAELSWRSFATLRFDFLGCGASDGDSRLITPSQMVQDTGAALAELARLSGKSRAHLVGYSLGGLIAVLSLEHFADKIASLSLLQAPYNLETELKRRYPMGFDGVRTSAYINAPIFRPSPAFKAELSHLGEAPARVVAKAAPRPVFLLGGGNDVIVPEQLNQTTWQALFQSHDYPTRCSSLPRADHGFSLEEDVFACISSLCEFLSQASAN